MNATESHLSVASPVAAVMMLAKREWIRFFRQRQRVVGAVGQPVLFWLLFGTGMSGSFRSGGQDFMTYYLPGTLALILLFTAIFTTISIIEDRREGFLQGVLVAPVPRWTIAAGKILGGAVIAWVQAMLFLTLCVIIQVVQPTLELVPVIALLMIGAITLTALGTCFAWPMESTQGFHAVMSLVLLPMWLLSGAFFPVPMPGSDSGLGQWLMHLVMRANPLSYTVAGLRQSLGAEQDPQTWMPGVVSCWTGSLLFMTIAFTVAWWIVVRFHRARNN